MVRRPSIAPQSTEVVVEDSLEKALRRFRKRVERFLILADFKKNTFYEKPGERRRRKKRKALARLRKRQRP